MDPRIAELRDRISAGDRAVLETVVERVGLVRELKALKEEQGLDFHDPEREARMLEDLLEASAGRLSEEGVRELLAALLAVTRRDA